MIKSKQGTLNIIIENLGLYHFTTLLFIGVNYLVFRYKVHLLEIDYSYISWEDLLYEVIQNLMYVFIPVVAYILNHSFNLFNTEKDKANEYDNTKHIVFYFFSSLTAYISMEVYDFGRLDLIPGLIAVGSCLMLTYYLMNTSTSSIRYLKIYFFWFSVFSLLYLLAITIDISQLTIIYCYVSFIFGTELIKFILQDKDESRSISFIPRLIVVFIFAMGTFSIVAFSLDFKSKIYGGVFALNKYAITSLNGETYYFLSNGYPFETSDYYVVKLKYGEFQYFNKINIVKFDIKPYLNCDDSILKRSVRWEYFRRNEIQEVLNELDTMLYRGKENFFFEPDSIGSVFLERMELLQNKYDDRFEVIPIDSVSFYRICK